jgi:hypothetical protein
MYWSPLEDRVKLTGSLPNLENERQWSIHDFRTCMMVNQRMRWLPMALYGVLTGL